MAVTVIMADRLGCRPGKGKTEATKIKYIAVPGNILTGGGTDTPPSSPEIKRYLTRQSAFKEAAEPLVFPRETRRHMSISLQGLTLSSCVLPLLLLILLLSCSHANN